MTKPVAHSCENINCGYQSFWSDWPRHPGCFCLYGLYKHNYSDTPYNLRADFETESRIFLRIQTFQVMYIQSIINCLI